jgi:NADPH2:quinone reductase
LTGGHGFDVVIDTVGDDNINASIEAVALYGDIITIQASGACDLFALQAKSASLHVVLMLIPMLHAIQRERHGAILKNIAALVDKKLVRPLLHPERFSFADVGKAHALLESGRAIGKVVICRESMS